MADFTREELEELGERIHGLSSPLYESHGERFTDKAELLRLLSMAERAVSQDTVRKLAEYVAIAAEPTNAREKERLWAWTAFSHDACRDLRPAAARLAEKGE